MLVSDFRHSGRVGHGQLWSLAHYLFKLAAITYAYTEITTSDQWYVWRDQMCPSRVAWEKLRKKLLQNDLVFCLTCALWLHGFVNIICHCVHRIHYGCTDIVNKNLYLQGNTHGLWKIFQRQYIYISIYHFSASIENRCAELITDLTHWGWYKVMTISSVCSWMKMCIFWFEFHCNLFWVVQSISFVPGCSVKVITGSDNGIVLNKQQTII